MAESNRIRELMSADPELTFERLAARAGVAEKTIRNAAKGRPTHSSTRKLIAQALGTTEAEVFSSVTPDYSSNASQA